MNLLIDIGNTRLKIGYALADGTRPQHLSLAITPAELPLLLPWLQQHHLQPQRALLVSVATIEVEQQVAALLQSISCPTRWLSSIHPCPLLHNGYDRPEQLGADRWLALIGVLAQQQHLHRPVVHASFGKRHSTR